jgi:formylglycine-generating enzyme required for sulfatase activity
MLQISRTGCLIRENPLKRWKRRRKAPEIHPHPLSPTHWIGNQPDRQGSFKPNGFGLYDMNGNVWEWVEDIYHGNYDGAPTDGSPWLEGDDQSRRAVRGGSWDYGPSFLRAAFRVGYATHVRSVDLGFRLARTLSP